MVGIEVLIILTSSTELVLIDLTTIGFIETQDMAEERLTIIPTEEIR